MSRNDDPDLSGIALYWLPLGAGGYSVRWNGRAFEAIDAAVHRRRPAALFHSALVVTSHRVRFAIEQGPAGPGPGRERGVVGTGPVGLRVAGRARLFRYEVRCWGGGQIPDIAEAVDSPRIMSTSLAAVDRVLGAVPDVPMLTWGRDESRTGEMWNSNSVVSWLLTRAGVDAARIEPPAHGRAPGWRAGVVVANRGPGEGT